MQHPTRFVVLAALAGAGCMISSTSTAPRAPGGGTAPTSSTGPTENTEGNTGSPPASGSTTGGGTNGGTPPAAPCPADAPTGATAIFTDDIIAHWTYGGFNDWSGAKLTTGTTCTGAKAVQYPVEAQYDGVQFIADADTDAVAGVKLSLRVHVSADAIFTVAAVSSIDEDPHQFIGDPNGISFKAGWQALLLDIPQNTTPKIAWILFEKQDKGSVVLTIDDVWMVP